MSTNWSGGGVHWAYVIITIVLMMPTRNMKEKKYKKKKCENEKYDKKIEKKEKYEKEKCEKGKYDALVLALFPAGQPPISKNCLLTSAKLFHHHPW